LTAAVLKKQSADASKKDAACYNFVKKNAGVSFKHFDIFQRRCMLVARSARSIDFLIIQWLCVIDHVSMRCSPDIASCLCITRLRKSPKRQILSQFGY